ncbi:DUF4352 domain-containing protein [Oceanobacillus neutriphilus]|uniref:DUF4352 domain-containing protein n=1 Tax=Oceanobacillus neutriphilus TaxID=531815 RepID=A0ABQ2NTL4_9BACI|nr:DUF4352 domain-containing protein [Oceanobacillus neutriphilus]GGP08558.1 hypothetical protein GCM10011346_09080 [Oceanobacillus neutriphilus]
MKKFIFLALICLVLTACSNGEKNTETQKTDNTDTTEKTDTAALEAEEEKPTYQIGKTATITSDLYGFDYEVTVNDFQLTREVDETPIEDYLIGAREEDRFAVVDVTIKNISEEAYVPNQMFSANFSAIDENGGDISNDEFFAAGDEELAPGEELTGHLVYLTDINYADTFVLKYEFMSDQETHFELPNPEQ